VGITRIVIRQATETITTCYSTGLNVLGSDLNTSNEDCVISKLSSSDEKQTFLSSVFITYSEHSSFGPFSLAMIELVYLKAS
jgi:hypothetical protein